MSIIKDSNLKTLNASEANISTLNVNKLNVQQLNFISSLVITVKKPDTSQQVIVCPYYKIGNLNILQIQETTNIGGPAVNQFYTFTLSEDLIPLKKQEFSCVFINGAGPAKIGYIEFDGVNQNMFKLYSTTGTMDNIVNVVLANTISWLSE